MAGATTWLAGPELTDETRQEALALVAAATADSEKPAPEETVDGLVSSLLLHPGLIPAVIAALSGRLISSDGEQVR